MFTGLPMSLGLRKDCDNDQWGCEQQGICMLIPPEGIVLQCTARQLCWNCATKTLFIFAESFNERWHAVPIYTYNGYAFATDTDAPMIVNGKLECAMP